MFRNRMTGQKPADELYASFKEAFPGIGSVVPTSTTAPNPRSMSLGDVTSDTTMTTQSRQHLEHDQDGFKDMDQTPKGNPETWRLTPSLLDPNSYAFASFANQPPGYCTPTPGGTNTFYHNQAGDLHTPSLGMGQMTPLSLPTSEGGVRAGPSLNMHAFLSDAMQPNPFAAHFDPFAPQDSYAPSKFQHQPTSYDFANPSATASPMDDHRMDQDSDMSSAPAFASGIDANMTATSPKSSDQFRFHVTLNAPTAMIKRVDEIPVTYLNKGQAYTISILDTAPNPSLSGPVTYRTFVRVSFEDEQQRQRPGACWQLWKEGRGTNEAHQRGGKLQAVECVDPTFTGDTENRVPKIDLQSASFDGFSLTWTPPLGGSPECAVAVRFNFLSTDFSHSKGVKGIPVRLCAKTEVVSAAAAAHDVPSPSLSPAELCFCKVKLFRDHGAERKLSNDVAHVKKSIEKLKQQIAQAESGMSEFGKKKRSPSAIAKAAAASSKPGKVHKHKRTWSMSSQSSAGGRSPPDDDLHHKLATMQDMFTSTRPLSVLYLGGVEQDDPDLHPVHLAGEPLDLTKVDCMSDAWTRRSSGGTGQLTGDSSLVSPASSSGGQGLKSSLTHSSTQQQQQPPKDWSSFQPTTIQADLQANPQHLASPPDQAVRVPKNAPGASESLGSFINAVDVDASYRPPAVEQTPRPVACFYVLPRLAGQQPANGCYRAVYLMQRSMRDLVNTIAAKFDIPADIVQRAIYVNPKGLNIMIDDDVVRQFPEGQDMILEVAEINDRDQTGTTVKHEWPPAAADIQIDDSPAGKRSAALEIRLSF